MQSTSSHSHAQSLLLVEKTVRKYIQKHSIIFIYIFPNIVFQRGYFYNALDRGCLAFDNVFMFSVYVSL